VTTQEAAKDQLQDVAVLWSCGAVTAWEVVRVACDVLVAGVDSPALCELAAVGHRDADYDVPSLLEAALSELGLTFYSFGCRGADEAAARALTARLLRGELTPRELASMIHQHYGHGLPLVERLAELDDAYDVIEYTDRTADEIDADVFAEARRVVGLGRH
jgi:hypothetical protein